MRDHIALLIMIFVPLVFSVTMHEFFHGIAAWFLGDPTAKACGRLTMNPFKHIDLVGLSVLLITRTVGWAKPVPVNPYMLRNKRRDTIIVAAAGITANIILAIVFSMLYNVIVNADLKYDPYFFAFEPMLKVAVALNINLVFFNLLPIAPLDGAHIIREMLPDEFRPYWVKAEPYMMWALVIMILTGITGKMLTEPTSWVIQALL